MRSEPSGETQQPVLTPLESAQSHSGGPRIGAHRIRLPILSFMADSLGTLLLNTAHTAPEPAHSGQRGRSGPIPIFDGPRGADRFYQL